MTTIKLKNGSGAPTAGDLVQGEPALDLTNKRLYTEDSGGTVIEVGTNPGTDVTFADNRKAIFGTGSDLQIYHDGSNSYIDDAAVGNLNIRGNNIVLGKYTGETAIECIANGAVNIYHDNSNLKLATTSTGIDVTGDMSLTDATPAINLYDSDNSTRTTLRNNSGISYLTTYGSTSGTYGSFILSSHDHTTSKEVLRADNTNIQFKTDDTLRGRFLSNGDYVLYNDAGTSTDFYWDASTSRLGLGTTAPNSTLEVSGTSAGGEVEGLRLTNSSTTTNTSSSIIFNLSTASADSAKIAAIRTNSPTSSDTELAFSQLRNGTLTERMRIDSSGNVGIGESAPDEALVVRGGAYSINQDGGIAVQAGNASSSHLKSAFKLKSNASGAFRTAIDATNGQTAGQTFEAISIPANTGFIGIGTTSPDTLLELKGADPILTIRDSETSVVSSNARLRLAESDASDTLGTYYDVALEGGNLTFGYSSGGGAIAERMRIGSGGDVRIGKTSSGIGTVGHEFGPTGYTYHTRDGGTVLDLNRLTSDGKIVKFYKDGTEVGSISVTASATAYNTSSDQRLKDNIVDAPSASDDIDAIQVRSFDWKADGSHQKYGMVAQELQTVAPDAVTEGDTEEDMMSVDYSKLVPMLVKEIQSLRARVAQLEGAN